MKLENACTKKVIADLKQEIADMKFEINTLIFGHQHFAGRDDILFYAGFPSYSAITSF